MKNRMERVDTYCTFRCPVTCIYFPRLTAGSSEMVIHSLAPRFCIRLTFFTDESVFVREPQGPGHRTADLVPAAQRSHLCSGLRSSRHVTLRVYTVADGQGGVTGPPCALDSEGKHTPGTRGRGLRTQQKTSVHTRQTSLCARSWCTACDAP